MPKKLLLAAAVSAVVLTASCGQATADRTSGAGKEPDSAEDTWNVKVFNNANNIPNLALFCVNHADPIAILATLSGGDSGKDKSSNFTPRPELDASYCGGRAK